MRIEYELKYRDYLLCNILHQLLSVTVQISFAGFGVLLFFLSHGDRSAWAAAIVGLLTYLAMWVAQLLFTVVYLYFGKNRSLLTRHIVEIQDEAFYDETRFGRSYHYWPGIAKIVSRPGFIAVYLNANAAHIIPARVFASPAQRQSFVAALEGKLRAASQEEHSK